jgi:5-methylcytosine-specific restriction endonuclease McrA
MKTRPLNWTIETVVRRKSRINPKPQYQRTAVWTEHKKQLLIDSILRQYDMPKFYLRVSEPPYDHEVVDGQQRLRTIWDFYEDDFALGSESGNVPEFGNLIGKTFSDLPSKAQDRIALFGLNLVELEEASDLEIRDLFLRLQEGMTLNPAERRNAEPGNMRDFIADLGENHRVFPMTHISPKRFDWHDLAAIVTCLEMAGGPTDVKAVSLKTMYRNNRNFNTDSGTARKVKRVLNYMSRILRDRPPEMRIKWGFVDLYLLVSQLDKQYVLSEREDDFAAFYISFEKERRDVNDPADLLASDASEWDRDMYQYIAAFETGGGTKQHVEARHEVYKRRFLNYTTDLVPKDPRRAFNADERLIIWRRDKGVCQSCTTSVSLEQMQADHIVPHSKGGRTIVENGQTLCGSCNLSKAASTEQN